MKSIRVLELKAIKFQNDGQLLNLLKNVNGIKHLQTLKLIGIPGFGAQLSHENALKEFFLFNEHL